MTDRKHRGKGLPQLEPTAEALSHGEETSLWDLEERFWTSGADSARATTAKDAVMIFPYPPGILQTDRLWSHLRQNTGWRSVEMKNRSSTLRGHLAVLAYLVSAEKDGSPVYEALCSSTYLHDDDRWLRISHQQTPIS